MVYCPPLSRIPVRFSGPAGAAAGPGDWPEAVEVRRRRVGVRVRRMSAREEAIVACEVCCVRL